MRAAVVDDELQGLNKDSPVLVNSMSIESGVFGICELLMCHRIRYSFSARYLLLILNHRCH